MSKKEITIVIATLLILIAIVFIVVTLINKKKNPVEPGNPEVPDIPRVEFSEKIEIVPTMDDQIKSDTSWCATFQLVWNDLKNEVVKQDIKMSPQPEIADNLNKESFTEDMISDEYYYKIYGPKSLSLKAEIEKGIKEKFNQTSDILNDFDWSEEATTASDPKRMFFYTMLYREFEYLYEFDKLDNGNFGKNTDVEYFGIDSNSNEELRSNIRVLYYNSKEDFAIVLKTKNNDEVIMVKSPDGNTFNEIYNNMNKKAENRVGSSYMEEEDFFKAPKLKFNVKKDYVELAGKMFTTTDGDVLEIAKALQTVQFEIDEKGGKVKSEAAIDVKDGLAIDPGAKPKPRYFYLDDTFALFLREEGKDMPYFAARIEDITKYQ